MPPGICPYVGLQPYTAAEREYFFGRESDVRVVSANLYAAPLTVFYGASGVGKSSVLMAGVVPQLEQTPRTAVVVFREWQSADFLSTLKQRCIEAAGRAAAKRVALDTSLPLDELLLKAAAACGTMVLLFDQFEEYFLYHEFSDAGRAFDGELARAVNREDIDASILLSLREDAVAKLDRFRARIPNLLANTLRLRHMDRAAAEIAIRRPLEVFNGTHGVEPVSIEDGLVMEILEQVRRGRVQIGHAGRGGEAARDEQDEIETPFLQLVMTRLWNEERSQRPTVLRRTTFVDRLGGAAKIVRSHLAGVMDRLTAEQRDVCARFFDRLVTPSGTKVACRLDDLREWAGDLGAQVPEVLEALNANRILRGVAAAGGARDVPQFEVFHDVLAPGILEWRDSFVAEQRRRAAKRDAENERRRAARLWNLSLALGVVAVFALGAFAYALRARAREAKALREAEVAKQSLKDAYTQLVKDLPADERRAYGSAKDVIDSGWVQAQRMPNVAAEPQPAPPDPAPAPTVASSPARVYLQIQDARQRAAADRINAALAGAGFTVSGIDPVKAGPKTNTEVRFFQKDHAAGAEQIAALLRDAGVEKVLVKYVPGYETSKRAAPQHYEIWFARTV